MVSSPSSEERSERSQVKSVSGKTQKRALGEANRCEDSGLKKRAQSCHHSAPTNVSRSSAPRPLPVTQFKKIFGEQDSITIEELAVRMEKMMEFHKEGQEQYEVLQKSEETRMRSSRLESGSGYILIANNIEGLDRRGPTSTDVAGEGELQYNHFILHHMILNSLRVFGVANADSIYFATAALFPHRLDQLSAALLFPRLCARFEPRFQAYDGNAPIEKNITGNENVDFLLQEGWRFPVKTSKKSCQQRQKSFSLWTMQEERKNPRKQAVKWLKEGDNTEKLPFIPNAPLVPCRHEGPCSQSPDCPCRQNGFCYHLCQCDAECVMRFPGCNCAPGNCRTKNHCQCARADFECNPLVCTRCDCGNNGSCHNMPIRRGLEKKMAVETSKIEGAGNGLFIKEAANVGELIVEYKGAKVSAEEVERRKKRSMDIGVSYIFHIPGGEAIDGEHVGNSSRFANNDDKKPSMNVACKIVGDEYRIGFYAARNLTAGEELTINYRWEQKQKEHFFKKQ